MEEKIEAVPTVKPEVHFALNDMAQSMLEGRLLTLQQMDELEMIYRELQDCEKDIVTIFDTYRSEETISKEEFLVAVGYFLVAEQQGPESGALKRVFKECELSSTEFARVSESISIPEYTKALLQEVYEKVSLKKPTS